MRTVQICGAGRAGDGTNTHVLTLGQALKDMGAWIFIWREEVYSNIQTRDSAFGLRAADQPVYGPDDEWDIVDAFDQGALVDITSEGRTPPITRLKEGGVLLYDSSPRLDYPNAGYEVHLEAVNDLLLSKQARVFGLPMGQMAKEKFQRYIVRGTIASGVISHLLGIPFEVILERFRQSFGDGSDIFNLNKDALLLGRQYAEDQGWQAQDLHVNYLTPAQENRQLLLGNEAVAAGAIVAGCRFYAGYPITPATEILEFMAERLNHFGGVVVQADSEMAAAHHVLGGSVAGARSMTATAGPGFSLMQEAISASGITETPMVIVISQRGGPGTGLPTRVGQEDLNEAIFGGHGDFARIVLAASEPEQAFYVMEKVFNLAERYQCPVFLLLDQMVSQSTYTTRPLNAGSFNIDRGKLLDIESAARTYNGNGSRYRRYEITSDGISPRIIPSTPGIHTYYNNTNEHTEEGYITEESSIRQIMMDKRFAKRMGLIKKDEYLPAPHVHGAPDGKIGFIGYGCVYGPILEAMSKLEEGGRKAKFLELRTLWPLHARDVKRFVQGCDQVYIVEHSAGAQLRGVIQREATGPSPRKLFSILRYDGKLMTPQYILDQMGVAQYGH